MNGNILWQKSLGGSSSDYAYSIQQTADGGFIVAGNSYSSDGDVTGNHGGPDYWVVKLSGEVQSCLSPSNLSVTNITATSAQLNWTIEGMPNFFLVSYHYQNGLTLYKRVSGTTSSVTLSNLTPATIYGWNIRANCFELKSSPVFGEQFKTALNKEEQLTNAVESFSLYPNPSSGSFTINLQTGEEASTSAAIQILNALGQAIYSQEGIINEGVLQKEIQLNGIAPGMYLVKVTGSDRVYTSQFNLLK